MLAFIFYLMFPPFHGAYCTIDDPDFDELRYEEQIAHCTRRVSTSEKIKICFRDGVEDRSSFTVDHIIPLSLGGSNGVENLWCQHYTLAVTNIEYEAYLLLKDNKLSRDEAVDMVLNAKFK